MIVITENIWFYIYVQYSYVFNGTTMEEQFLIGNLEVINLVLDLANSLIHGLQTQNL